MIRLKKIVLTLVTVISLGILIYLEARLLITGHYKTAFIDPLEKTNVKFLGVIIMILIVVTSNLYLKTIRGKFILSASFFIVIVGLTLTTLNLLNKSEKTVYRQDLGLHAYYLYLNHESKEYILEYTKPFGKLTFVGHFEQIGNIVKLDKNIIEAFDLKGYLNEGPKWSLDLEKMKKIK